MKKRESYGAQHIESKITHLLKPLFKADKQNFLIINNITKNWEKIIGKKYYKFCEPKSINFAKNDSRHAKLTIAVYNSAVGFFLKNNSENLIERIAVLYGYRAITKIIIKQETKDVEITKKQEAKLCEKDEFELQESLKNIKDRDLAEIMARLGRDILSKK